MAVLALAVEHLSELSLVVEPLHLEPDLREKIVLRDHIDLSALFDGPAEFDALSQGVHRRALRHDVQARVQRLYREGRVLVEIVGKDDGVDRTAVYHLIVVGERAQRSVPVVSLFAQIQLVLASVAHRRQFEIGVFGRIHEYLPASGPHNTQSYHFQVLSVFNNSGAETAPEGFRTGAPRRPRRGRRFPRYRRAVRRAAPREFRSREC